MIKHLSVQAIAFDFDGVLIDSQPLHLHAWRCALDAHELQVKDLSKRILGVSVQDFVRSLGLDERTGRHLADAKREQLLTLARATVPSLYEGVSETLELLSTRFKMALVSSAEPELVAIVVEHYRLEHLFSVVVLESDFQRAKPDPEPYQIATARLEVLARRTAAVEDSRVGIESALAAGLRTIGITHTTTEEFLSPADIIIRDFSQIPGVLL